MLLSGSLDNVIKLWNLTDGLVIRNFTGHSGYVIQNI
jgi:WD40 repeat protein